MAPFPPAAQSSSTGSGGQGGSQGTSAQGANSRRWLSSSVPAPVRKRRCARRCTRKGRLCHCCGLELYRATVKKVKKPVNKVEIAPKYRVQRKSLRVRKPKVPFGEEPPKKMTGYQSDMMTINKAEESVAKKEEDFAMVAEKVPASQAPKPAEGSMAEQEDSIQVAEGSAAGIPPMEEEAAKENQVAELAPRRRPRKQVRKIIPEPPAAPAEEVNVQVDGDNDEEELCELMHYSHIFDDDWQDMACDCSEHLGNLFLK